MTEFRCELLSADQLAALAAAPLPRGIPAGDARRSLHRDLYLDTPDDSLRRRGIICRLRTRADGAGTRTRLVPTVPRMDVAAAGGDVAEVLSAKNKVVRRLRGIIDPSAL